MEIAQTAHKNGMSENQSRIREGKKMKNIGIKFIGVAAAALLVFSAISVSAQPAKKMDKKDIVDTAVAAGQFTILAKALEAAGLIDALKGAGKFTVFAPTDEAFGKLPAGTLEMLLKPENKDKLKAILLYHVVEGKVAAKDVVKLNGQSVKTLQGGTVMINTTNGVVINSSKVTTADVWASNGVIHVIDTVLIPN
jgi:uncharacterized surface protein with fasciclin (FAS1) repeats